MNPETFFDKFGLLADTPNGVQKLRELILQLAVQGKLVPQDPNDEPASVLLEKIKAEKEKLVKEKKIKKVKKLPDFEESDLPYELPNGWLWIQLDQIANSVHYGYTASANHDLKDIRLLRITDIQNGRVNWDSVPGCEIDEKNVENYRLYEGDLLIARTGGTIGKSYLVEKPTLCAVFASYIIRVIPNSQLFPKYLKIFLESSLYWKQLYEKSMGTGQPNVNGTSLRALILPLPPLNEQHRIVAKVDQLMVLCDELEARQQKKQEARLRLNSAALDKVLTAHEPAEFANHWQRVCDNFDLLYDNPETVGELRKAILQLAVQGKLVRQDENDEPAAVLLEKIRVEKERLVKEKKIKKSRVLPPINQEQIPYELPYGWEWVRLGDVGHDCGQKKPDIKFTYIDVSAINKERGVISDNVDILEPNEAPSRARKLVSEGSVIYATVRPYLLNIAIIDRQFEPDPIVSTAFAVIHPFSGILNKYLYFYLRSKPFIAYVESEMIGMAYPAINDGKLYQGLVPVPPSKEQRRIVAKVDQLMALCDELEAKLNQSQTNGAKLMEAVVAELVGA